MICPSRWLAGLRRRKRFVIYALLPLFGWSTAFGAACSGMPPASAATAASPMSAPHPGHDAAAAHSAHAHGQAVDADEPNASPRVCPHCALDTGKAASGDAACDVAEAQEPRHVAPAKDKSERVALVLAPAWRLPAARAAPSPTRKFPSTVAPLAAAVPLHVIHCVLLI